MDGKLARLSGCVNSPDNVSGAYHVPMDRREKLRRLIGDEFGGSVADFARAIKRAPSQVSQWLGGHRSIGDAGARHIEQTLQLGIGWFDLPYSKRGEKRRIDAERRRIPVINYIQAGNPREVVDDYAAGDGFDTIGIDETTARQLGRHSFALVVEGESMLPEFRPGDVVVVDPDAPVRPGDIVVAKLQHSQSATLKKYRNRGSDTSGRPVFELVPLNDNYPTLQVSADNPGDVIGRVVEHRRKL